MGREALAQARRDAGFNTQESLAEHLGVAVSTVARLEQGVTREPQDRRRYAEALGISMERLVELLAADEPDETSDWTTVEPPDLDDIEALELIRRVEASDTGPATIDGLEQATELLARSYTSTPPAELLTPLRAYREYVTRLLDGRATLAQRRHLTVIGGWLSLLTAICHIDLRRYRATAANLAAARTMAAEADHSVITAWVMETEAWQALTDGDAARAVDLSQAARALTSPGTSAHVQTAIQEARASARLGLAKETHRLLDESAWSLDQMPPPEHPEHHFTFDRRKHISYTATALSWLGDRSPDAEEYARKAVAQYDDTTGDGRWRSRLASARLDLALILARDDQPTEAASLGQEALGSGALRPSNLWRAVELDHQLVARYDGTAEIEEFHDRVRAAVPSPKAKGRALGPGPAAIRQPGSRPGHGPAIRVTGCDQPPQRHPGRDEAPGTSPDGGGSAGLRG